MINIIILTSLVIVAAVAVPANSGHYRTDFEYNSETNAFYKLHIDGHHVTLAQSICRLEGGELMVPKTKQDIMQAHAMFKKYPDLGDYLLLGEDGLTHEEAEETPLITLEISSSEEYENSRRTCEVMTRKGDIEVMHCYRLFPFVCKVEADNAAYDARCDVYASGYTYIQSVGSCYKVPDVAVTWNEAAAECRAQNAHLLVLNSETEQQAIRKFLETAPRLRSSHVDYFYLAGIRAFKPDRTFRTIFNETLDQAGYNGWQPGEPNNSQDKEYCGSVFRTDGKYNDVECFEKFAFVCEKEV